MINKGEVYSIFVYFHTFLVTQFFATLRVFQSDGGGEYLSNKFKKLPPYQGYYPSNVLSLHSGTKWPC